jgi:V/A-type H+-transporting ATPase subunit F
MSKAVAIGYKEDILPFSVWGMQLMPVTSADEFSITLDKVLQDTTVALVVVSEAIVKDSPPVLGVLKSCIARSPVPILMLPTHRGSYGTGLRETADVIKRAIGIDILEEA